MSQLSLIGIAILFACVVRSQPAAVNPNCSRDILESYGLQGQLVPQKITIEMCPTIEKSCCLKEDQLSMYTNWIHNNEEKNVETRYKNLNIVYSNLLITLTKVTRIAETIKKKLMVKRVANCKILAERVLSFQIEKIASRIRENLNEMEDFFVDTYKGFYCAVCDYDNHQYFNLKKKEITYSEKFCRDVTERTLPILLFFHVQVVKYFNLVSKFLTSCDFRGDYKLEAEVDKDQLFTVMPDIKHTLSECRNYRNHKSWFVYCKDLCENFQISQFSEFFEPNLDKIEDYTDYIEGLIKVFNDEELRAPKDLSMPKKSDGSAKKKKVRLLQEKEVKDNNPDLIFKSGLNSKVQLETFKTVFYEDGLSLYDEGRNTLINTEMFNQIKTTIHLTRPQTTSVYVPPTKTNPDGTKTTVGLSPSEGGPTSGKPVGGVKPGSSSGGSTGSSSGGASADSTETKNKNKGGNSGGNTLTSDDKKMLASAGKSACFFSALASFFLLLLS